MIEFVIKVTKQKVNKLIKMLLSERKIHNLVCENDLCLSQIDVSPEMVIKTTTHMIPCYFAASTNYVFCYFLDQKTPSVRNDSLCR